MRHGLPLLHDPNRRALLREVTFTPMNPPPPAPSVLFDWDLGEFDRLVENCAFDDSLQLILPHLTPSGKVLEAGCGPGHVVAYLLARGFDVEGVELNAPVVAEMARLRPALPLRVSDVSNLDRPDGFYQAVLSFGVIEHFKGGPSAVLREHHRILTPGGIAMFSVPSLTVVRRIKRVWYFASAPFRPSLNPFLRRLTGRPPRAAQSTRSRRLPIRGESSSRRILRISFPPARSRKSDT